MVFLAYRLRKKRLLISSCCEATNDQNGTKYEMMKWNEIKMLVDGSSVFICFKKPSA